VIGDRGRIPWRISDDFAHFKALTMGGTLVMGRATYDSIGRPLPGRTTVVVTRNPDWSADGVLVAHSLDTALAIAAEQPGETYVVGGTQIYEQALPLATHQVLTEVHRSPDGDAHYPDFDTEEKRAAAGATIPLHHRPTEPAEIGEAVAYLTTSTIVTGAYLRVDGGLVIGKY